MSDEQVCLEEGCDLPGKVRKRCGAHYQKWRRANLNSVGAPQDDPRMGFVQRHTALLDDAPDGLLSAAERDFLAWFVLTAAMAARGVIPITPEMRAQTLHGAVDAILKESVAG